MRESLFSQGLHLLLNVVICLGMAACGNAPTVELKNPLAPGPEETPHEKPGSPTTPDDVTTPEPDEGRTPGAPDSGETPGTPSPRNPDVYRLVCRSRFFSTLTTMTTAAQSGATSPSIRLIDASAPDDESGSLETFKYDIKDAKDPLLAEIVDPSILNLLFLGRRHDQPYASKKVVYSSKVDRAYRRGRAQALAVEPEYPSMAQHLAQFLQFPLRSHGVSNQGRYFIVPQRGRFQVLQASTGAEVGVLELDPRSYVLPEIDERLNAFTALRFDGRRFFPVFYRIRITTSNLTLVSEIEVPRPPADRTALPLVRWGEKGRVWGEVPVERFTKPPLGTSEIHFRFWSSEGHTQPRISSYGVSGGALIPTQMTAYETDQGSRLVLAVEKIQTLSTYPRKGQVESASVLILRLSENGTWREESRVEYPREAVSSIEKHGLREKSGVYSFHSSPDLKKVFAVFQGALGGQLYVLENDAFQTLSWQPDCETPVIGAKSAEEEP